ncbi:MAG: hypothetical protein Q7S11_01560 [bacterium]|nr:hypothetical protein [bacterium]
MNTRVPFLRWKPLHFGLALLTIAVTVGIIVGLIYYTLDTIVIVAVVIIGITMAGIVNKTNDNVERAKNWRNRPVVPDEVLSFGLEKEIDEEKNK